MATFHNILRMGTQPGASTRKSRPLGGMRLDWLVTVLACWTVGGIFLDGWAHVHGKVDSSFFTVWHALLYSGYLAQTLLLGLALVLNGVSGKYGRFWFWPTFADSGCNS